MLYLDDRLPSHPKILKAGEKIGRNGPALALAMYVAGLAYAREHETDGFVPDVFISGSGAAFSSPGAIAEALAARSVKLWERRRGGYQIHDYHDWNRKSSEIKAQREKWRRKKAAQRHGNNGRFVSTLSTGDKSVVSTLSHRDSRARTRSHVPRTTDHGGTACTNKPLREIRKACTAGDITGAVAPEFSRQTNAQKKNTGAKHAQPAAHVSSTLRDCARHAAPRPTRRLLRVVRENQTPTRATASRLPDAAGHDCRTGSGRARAREGRDSSHAAAGLHDAAAATRRNARADTRRSVASPRGSQSAWPHAHDQADAGRASTDASTPRTAVGTATGDGAHSRSGAGVRGRRSERAA